MILILSKFESNVRQFYQTFGAKVGRFLFSGGSAAATNLIVYYVAYATFHVHYILASVLAFGLSFIVSFTMQKFWTFRDKSLALVNTQLVKYFVVMIINLAINTALLYWLVEYVHVNKLLAQIVAMAALAFVSFFVYQFVIFKPVPTPARARGEFR